MKRRDALKALGTTAAGLSLVALATRGRQEGKQEHMAADAQRLPVVFLPHGGGPWPFVDLPFVDKAEVAPLENYLRQLPDKLAGEPKALLVISAHWEESVPTVMTAMSPPMLYDYYGFPPESYQITWPAPGAPELASRVRALLGRAGFDSADDAQRGFDHGTFVPLKLMYPEAQLPTVQLSLMKHLRPAEHVAMGRALAPLRDEGVLIIGSGMSYHNLREFFGGRGRPASEAFDAWLQEAALAEPASRDARLLEWARAPSARAAHPREEHLLPLMVIAGAAGSDLGRLGYGGTFSDARISAFEYG